MGVGEICSEIIGWNPTPQQVVASKLASSFPINACRIYRVNLQSFDGLVADKVGPRKNPKCWDKGAKVSGDSPEGRSSISQLRKELALIEFLGISSLRSL